MLKSDSTKIFEKSRLYSEDELYILIAKYNLISTDCIKDDGEITVGFNEEDEPRWEFTLVTDVDLLPQLFKLRWSEFL